MKLRQIAILTVGLCLTGSAGSVTPAQEAVAVRAVHVFVALCDNEHQGIQPVPDELGNGDDPAHNLYWGALYGVKTFFSRSEEWELVATVEKPRDAVLERLVFKHTTADVYLVADAYKGSEIKQALADFLAAASGNGKETVSVEVDSQDVSFDVGGASDLVAYVGHNGLMDFTLDADARQSDDGADVKEVGDAAASRDAVVLCCASRSYFATLLSDAGARPLLLTTGLMAPEAYTLKAALDGWIANETPRQIRLRAAKAYDEHQDCTLDAAKRLFDAGEE